MATFLSLLSYQRAFAAANGFIAKKVHTGDNVVSLLKEHRFTDKERERVLALVPSLHKMYLQLDVAYLVKQDVSGTEIRLYEPQADLVYIVKKSAEGISARKARVGFKTSIARVDGQVRGSLMANILDKVNSNWVASRFIDAYIMDYNLNRGLTRGAKFWLMVEKKYDGPFFIRYGEVLQTSLQIRTRTVQKRYVRIDNQNGGVFISESDLLKNRPYYAPVSYLRVASLFQPHRRHPITKRIQPHMGVDFELPEGDPIYAARTGIVVRYGKNNAAGNYVVLMHGNGLETSYNHMRRVDPKIHRGLKLVTGEKLGEVGCTGYCTKAHLHFAVRQKGRMVDPLKYLRPYPIFAENMLHAKVAQF
jgi:murein DD-endopeptidase MepM/ murein hydrolase activator NlpD